MDTISAHRILVKGISTLYFEAGTGPVMLLLHGNVTTVRSWQRIMTEFESTHRVLALSIPGYGGTSPLDEPWPDSLVSFVAAFLDVLSIDTVMLVGHSAGGLIAARFTLQHPSRVSRLVLVDSAGLGRAANPLLIATAQLPDWMVSLSINALLLPGSGVARALATGIQLRRPWAVTPREWIDQIRMTGTRSLLRTSYDLVRIAVGPAGQRSRYSVTDRLGELQMPTLVVWGLTDEIFPFWQGMLAARKIPQGRFAIITSGGHISYLDNHVQFIDFVGPFLRDDLKEREAIGDADSPEGLKQ